MFKKSLDAKSTFTYNGVEIKDLTESIYKDINLLMPNAVSYYKASKEMSMRPDKIAYSLYGDMSYAEIVLKESGIDNPFAIEEGDIISAVPLNSAYFNIKDDDEFEAEDGYTNTSQTETPYDLIANYHKYIDKKKVPTDPGSELNTTQISSIDPALPAIEPNLANKGKSGIFVENGKIYFGNAVSSVPTDVIDIDGTNETNSPLVDCAKNGVSLGQFLNAAIKNSIR